MTLIDRPDSLIALAVIDAEGRRVDPVLDPYVVIADPAGADRPDTPCDLFVVRVGKSGYWPSGVSLPDYASAEACAARLNAAMDWTEEGVIRTVVASMGFAPQNACCDAQGTA